MASKFEINLNLLINNYKTASAQFETDNLSALFFGDESKKLISNVIFVPKQADKIQSTLDRLLLSLSVRNQFIGCDDPAGGSVKKFANLKLNLSLLKTMSAQKLSTRLTTVKNNDVLSVPTDGVNIKVDFQLKLSQLKGKSLADLLIAQFDAIKEQVKKSVFENEDKTLTIDGSQKGSTLKTISKNWKKDSPSTPTFYCRLNGDSELILKLNSTDLDQEKAINWNFSILLRTSPEILDSELHELINKQFENILQQASNLFIQKDELFEIECLTFWLPNHSDFIHVVLPLDDNKRDEVVNEVAATFNVAHPKIAFSTKKSVKLLRLPVKEVGLLANPHEFLKVNPIGQVEIVHGLYYYHHYMQDNFDDSGWGCAYRSFQTVCSWLKQQGHINKQIPTHKEIQQTLVDIGDKPASFVGSKKWIGSTELSFCLETMFGINSKILTTNSGAEIGEHARQLLYHFENYGGPVMIGGGMLAHTILGVDYNTKSGECRYLILDPHFTGDENLGEILANGWCGWKNANFWNKNDFYNLLLPLTPPIV